MSCSTKEVLFVGGPADGTRRMQEIHCPTVRFPVYPECPTYIPVEDSPEPLTIDIFTYRYLSLPDDLTIAYPEDWDRGFETPFSKVIKALYRGYVGRKQ